MLEQTHETPSWRRDSRFTEFIHLFDAKRWFDAHEVLEAVWLETTGPERSLLQGLIQLAVALEHGKRGNRAGARKVLASARRRLAPFGAHRAGISLAQLVDGVAEWLDGRSARPPRLGPLVELTIRRDSHLAQPCRGDDEDPTPAQRTLDHSGPTQGPRELKDRQ